MAVVTHDGAVRRPSTIAVGTAVWLTSEVMLFGGLFAAYFTLRTSAHGPWPPRGAHLEVAPAAVFTALLVLSSGTVQLAVRAAEAGDRRGTRQWLVVTAALGVVFLANQVREWLTVPFSPSSHSFGSAFFVMTGFHGAHVTGGVLALLAIAARVGTRRFGPDEVPTVHVISYYWHLVDVVWLAMFTTLFLVR